MALLPVFFNLFIFSCLKRTNAFHEHSGIKDYWSANGLCQKTHTADFFRIPCSKMSKGYLLRMAKGCFFWGGMEEQETKSPMEIYQHLGGQLDFLLQYKGVKEFTCEISLPHRCLLDHFDLRTMPCYKRNTLQR